MNLHESGTPCDHDVLHIGERRKLGGPDQDRCLFPDAKVLKEGLAPVVAYKMSRWVKLEMD